MNTSYYNAPVLGFLITDPNTILGSLAAAHHHALEHLQRNAWIEQISILQHELRDLKHGHIFFEFSIPRMGKRADCVLIVRGTIIVIEFKVGSTSYSGLGIDQVHDYALDLKNFHLGSHSLPIIPVLVSTEAPEFPTTLSWADDLVAEPITINARQISAIVGNITDINVDAESIDAPTWATSGYQPTPTIIEAAEALYQSHSVEEITRSDAGARNLSVTNSRIAEIIELSKTRQQKSICFITGVPGAGKTLAGLNIAARRAQNQAGEDAVFLSGNGPLVQVLQEALARDQKTRDNTPKKAALRSAKKFIQNIHHFRDHYLDDRSTPFEKIVLFDEAQRAWSKEQAIKFMKKKHPDQKFDQSEPEFLLSVMDRHDDWCTIVCLIGGGQEINTGEAGISEWLEALRTHYPHWSVYASSLLNDPHYTVDFRAHSLLNASDIQEHDDLHLSVSIRSFRAEGLSRLISLLLDNKPHEAAVELKSIANTYPLVVTRDLNSTRAWLKEKARGTERYGLVASSGAYRLRPEGLHLKSKIDPPAWFLNDRHDIRSSYYLEEVATEFDIQGLELDWVGMCWDADFRHQGGAWSHYSFRGSKWQNVRDQSRKFYLTNAYRVLLTRARQGMIIFIPQGDNLDSTRPTTYYDETYEFLRSCGLPELPPRAQ